ncbi:MAG: hypothetical protein ACRD8Z_24735, partial [Nitrososphaeraceae archaeon]
SLVSCKHPCFDPLKSILLFVVRAPSLQLARNNIYKWGVIMSFRTTKRIKVIHLSLTLES